MMKTEAGQCGFVSHVRVDDDDAWMRVDDSTFCRKLYSVWPPTFHPQ